jgi:hypothetical protein
MHGGGIHMQFSVLVQIGAALGIDIRRTTYKFCLPDNTDAAWRPTCTVYTAYRIPERELTHRRVFGVCPTPARSSWESLTRRSTEDCID